MHRHCGTNNRAPRWAFTDPRKPEVRPGAREESASPAWLAAETSADKIRQQWVRSEFSHRLPSVKCDTDRWYPIATDGYHW